VLVTVDDLKALMEFLTRDDTPGAAQLCVEFDGGSFTEAEELRTLSDMEMNSLRLKTQRVEVVLNPSSAFAVGEREEAEAVYRTWARARQTPLRRPPAYALLSFFIPLVMTVVSSTLLMLDKTFLSYPLAGFLTFTCVYLGFSIRRGHAKRNMFYAVIVPLSLDEYRQSRSSQMYPRRSWIVAIVSAVVAAAAVAVAIWVKVTSK
jgi:hypothetical protein